MITSIYIKNFKAFKKAELAPSNLTLIIGPDGMGKTSFLLLLLLLRQSYKKKTLPDKGLSLNGDYLIIGGGKDTHAQNGEGDTRGFKLEWDDKFDITFEFSYSPNSDLQPVTSFNKPYSFNPFSTALFIKKFQ